MRDDTTGVGAEGGRERTELRVEAVWAMSRSLERESAPEVERADASASAPHALADAEARLRRAVVTYARAMRREGLPPERVVVLMKQSLREAGTGVEPPRRRALTERATIWCIAAYFEDADAEPPSAPGATGERGD